MRGPAGCLKQRYYCNKMLPFYLYKDRIEKEKDTDIKAELRKGNTVEIIEDSLNDY